MLGHLKPIFCNIQNEYKDTFWLHYCSVCAALRQKNSLPYSLVLNNEITFVLIAFSENIEQKNEATTQCPAKLFFSKKNIFHHQITEIAADLSIVLAYIKTLDWHVDKPKFYKKLIVNRLKRKFNKIYPKFSQNFQEILQKYITITQENEQNFEKVQNLSGELAQNIVLEIGKYTSASTNKIENIGLVFEKLGKMIGIADHLIDFEADLLTNQYNPIIENSKHNQTTYEIEYKNLLSKFYLLKNDLERNFLNEQSQHFVVILKNALKQLIQKIKQNTPKTIFNDFTFKEINIVHADCDCGGCDACSCDSCDCEGCEDCCNCCDCCDCCDRDCGKRKKRQEN